jgi:hypothetical protein
LRLILTKHDISEKSKMPKTIEKAQISKKIRKMVSAYNILSTFHFKAKKSATPQYIIYPSSNFLFVRSI